MKKIKKSPFILLLVVAFLSLLSGCKQYDNFTTYFNTYYNKKRIIAEAEDEFSYQEEKKRVKPRVFVPETKISVPNIPKSGTPPFMTEFIIDQQKLQPVKVKLDSIIIKGSKILARHPKSDYIEGTLYLMALAYFYRNEWLPSQIKCSEQIDRFPAGELSPDAHLLLCKNLFIQRKFHAGKIMLSRTVDISWQLRRYDILSEAFRLEAELALYENDLDAAVRPYKQAIAQSDDGLMKAKWQLDMAALLYRINKFDQAEKAFAKVDDYSPDYLATFEASIYRALSLMRLSRFEEANKILKKLESDGKFEEWQSYIFAAKMTELRLRNDDKNFSIAEKFADSAYVNHPLIIANYYEKGMDLYNNNEYSIAKRFFARSRNMRTPVYSASEKMFFLLNAWEQKHLTIDQTLNSFKDSTEIPNEVKSIVALNSFELGRVHEQLGNLDSCTIFYKQAVDYSPIEDENTARYIYAYIRMIQDGYPMLADSLYDILVDRYPYTEYGQEAIRVQGYTENYLIDPVYETFKSGQKLRLSREFEFAITQFLKVFINWENSPLAPRALYNIGWIFEKDLRQADSAYYYYKLLVDKYPDSEYAKDVKNSVLYLAHVKTGAPLPDDLNPQKQESQKPQFQLKGEGQDENIKVNAKTLDPGSFDSSPAEILNDPMKLLNKATESISPENLIPDLKLNLPQEFNKMFHSEPDTTNQNIEELEEKK